MSQSLQLMEIVLFLRQYGFIINHFNSITNNYGENFETGC